MATINIFLTGSTGFLGGKLIKNLVERKHNLYVLARNTDKSQKLKESFTEDEQKLINIVEGDITLPLCGLKQEQVFELVSKIDIFYHLAALVKFDQDLRDELFAINYDGTKHSLELADELGVKKFYYVSTAYTVGKSNNGVEGLYPVDADYNNPYEESKVKSEHLAFEYKDKMDVSIFRPSIIVGDSKTGEADSSFTLYGFLRGLEVFKKRMNRKKDASSHVYRLVGSKEGTSNFVPVDYVSDVLTIAVESAKKDTVYHIVNTNPPTNFEILEIIKEAVEFEQLTIIEKKNAFDLNNEELMLNKVVDAFDGYLDRDISFTDANTQMLISDSFVKPLNMDKAMLEMIIKNYK